MFDRKKINDDQLINLSNSYQSAVACLAGLSSKYPEYGGIWNIVKHKMEVIKITLESKKIPLDSQIREADISTMLNHELQDLILADDAILPLFRLDKVYALLGTKSQHTEDVSKRSDKRIK